MTDAPPAAAGPPAFLHPPASLQDWLSKGIYEATYFASLFTFTFGFSIRSTGRRHVPRRGPVLFIANHQSFLDPLLIGLAVRRHLCYLARDTLFRQPAFAWIIRMLNAVPIDQEGLGIQGLRSILALLQAGRAVVIFPEGGRTWNGHLNPFQPGVQLLIKKTKAPVIPVGIAGAFEAWPRSRPLPVPAPLFLPARKGGIAVAVGRQLDARHYVELPRQQMLDELFRAVKGQCDAAERLRRKPEAATDGTRVKRHLFVTLGDN